LLLWLGWIGVDLFFVLSGYLITGVLLDAKRRPDYFKNFYARRALRILPLYYGFLAVILLIPRQTPIASSLGADYLADHMLWFWTHTTNWLMASPSGYAGASRAGFGGLWSLAIEEQFYLAWPIIVLLTSRRGLALTCGLLWLGAIATRTWLALSAAPVPVAYVVTPARLDPLLVGALLALAARRPNALSAMPHRAAIGVGIVGLACFVLIGHSPTPQDTGLFAIVVTTLAVGWGGTLGITLTGRSRQWCAAMEHPALRWCGRYSYAMYLFQPAIDHLLRGSGISAERLGFWGFGGLGFGCTCAAAFASWHLWEKHWLALKDRFPRRTAEMIPVP
jgi:peptidoglycan/LPS O-acetylase OafA/YrhL